MFSTPDPSQIMRANLKANAYLNPLQSALVDFILPTDPKVAPVVIRIFNHINTTLQLALALKAFSYLSGVSIKLISAVSFTTLFSAVVVGIFAGVLADSLFTKARADLGDWLFKRGLAYGPHQTSENHLKYRVSDKLSALQTTLEHYVSNWKLIIQNQNGSQITHLLKDEAYLWEEEEYALLGDSNFKEVFEAFIRGTKVAIQKIPNAKAHEADTLFQDLVLKHADSLKPIVNDKLEYFLFPTDLATLEAYKKQLAAYLKKEIPGLPEYDELNKVKLLRLTTRFHSDTGGKDSDLLALVSNGANLFKTCPKPSEEASNKGVWISGNDYRALVEARRGIESALKNKDALEVREGVKLPHALLFTEAMQQISTAIHASQQPAAS